jgi:hypothetical protein
MRIFIAGLIGGIVLFVWGAVAHVALPIGEMGFKVAANQDAAIPALAATADKGAGVYLIPGMAPEQWRDEAQMNAFIEKHQSTPYAFVVYNPAGNPSMLTMAAPLIKQFAFCLITGLLAAWVMAASAASFGTRVAMGAAMGLIAWVSISLPYWNWYQFPMAFTIGQLLDSGVGLLLASFPMAWWLGRRRA